MWSKAKITACILNFAANCLNSCIYRKTILSAKWVVWAAIASFLAKPNASCDSLWACCSGWCRGRQTYRGPCRTPRWPPRSWAPRTWSCSARGGAPKPTGQRGKLPPATSAACGFSSWLWVKMHLKTGQGTTSTAYSHAAELKATCQYRCF